MKINAQMIKRKIEEKEEMVLELKYVSGSKRHSILFSPFGTVTALKI